jgi:hypothetical protein
VSLPLNGATDRADEARHGRDDAGRATGDDAPADLLTAHGATE